MFICKECNKKLPKEKRVDDDWYLFGMISYGPCEICKKTKPCINN